MKLVTIRVLHNTTRTGPIGSVYAVPVEKAEDWFKRGLAEPVEPTPEKKKRATSK